MSEEKTIKMPKGVPMPNNKVKIAVVIDRIIFDWVVVNGKKNELSFSDSINDIAKCGVLCLREAEEL